MTRVSRNNGSQFLELLGEADPAVRRLAFETVALSRGRRLFALDEFQSHVYFPTTAVCSWVIQTKDGRSVEVASIGSEGMLGLPAYLGVVCLFNAAVVQVSGGALRVPASVFNALARRSEPIDALVRGYIAFRWRSASQTIACNTLHSIEQRACRWLLTMRDRLGRNEFSLTHEFFAEMLGTHRQTVTVVAGKLQREGMIRYRRGLVHILDGERVGALACECYDVNKDVYARTLARFL